MVFSEDILFSSNDDIIPVSEMDNSSQNVISFDNMFAKRIKIMSSIILFKGVIKVAA